MLDGSDRGDESQVAADTREYKEREFSCPYCPYISSQKGKLQRHMRTHTGEKPFACSFCPYRAAQDSVLKNHIRIHTGEKPFQCSECSYRTAKGANLKRHLLTHNRGKQYFCPHCCQCYGDIHTLRQHILTHSDAHVLWSCCWGFSFLNNYTVLLWKLFLDSPQTNKRTQSKKLPAMWDGVGLAIFLNKRCSSWSQSSDVSVFKHLDAFIFCWVEGSTERRESEP